ncbi:MAG: hypothetical protein WKF29_03650, partial [Thermoleophilaceae bacterium]
LRAAMPMIHERGITLVGVTVTNLDSHTAAQLVLPFDDGDATALDAVIDHVRDRFGTYALTRAVQLGEGLGTFLEPPPT